MNSIESRQEIDASISTGSVAAASRALAELWAREKNPSGAAFLAFLADQARAHGARKLQGWFVPTRKNASARDFYPSHDSSKVQPDGESAPWSLDISVTTLSCPDWISLQVLNGDPKQ